MNCKVEVNLVRKQQKHTKNPVLVGSNGYDIFGITSMTILDKLVNIACQTAHGNWNSLLLKLQ